MLRTSVLPWTEDMQLMDAYRAPLYEVFKLLEIVRNHESAGKWVAYAYTYIYTKNLIYMHLNVHMYIMNAFILLFACLIYIEKLICLKLKVFICSLLP